MFSEKTKKIGKLAKEAGKKIKSLAEKNKRSYKIEKQKLIRGIGKSRLIQNIKKNNLIQRIGKNSLIQQIQKDEKRNLIQQIGKNKLIQQIQRVDKNSLIQRTQKAGKNNFIRKIREIKKNGFIKEIEKNRSNAIIAFFVVWLVSATVLQQIALSLLMGFFGGVIWFCITRYIPTLKKQNYFNRVEAELPFVLLEMSIELNVQRPFEKILEHSAESEYFFAGKEFQKVHQEISVKGADVQEALLHFSERLQSTQSKRAIIQLIHAYEQGTKQNKGQNIKRIANELLAKQRIQAKAFSGKLALFSLIFIVVSAIVPALFQSFVLVGSAFLSIDFSPLQVLLIIAFGFPLLDLGVLMYIKHKTPVFLQ